MRLQLLLLCWLAAENSATASLLCRNGATYDDLMYLCHCPTNFYGELCEHAFADNDPCDRLSSIPTITDATGVHRVGNTAECSGSDCVDFSTLTAGWYRLASPAGAHFISSYACLNVTPNCGSSNPYILTQLEDEGNPSRPLYRGKFFRFDSSSPSCFDSTRTYFPVRILDCTTAKLYFLVPTLNSRHHYCIGDRKRCSAGLRSSDGSGFEPCYNATCIPSLRPGVAEPQLSLDPPQASNNRFFRCEVADLFTTGTGAPRYRVSFRLTFHNGTSREVTDCGQSNVTLATGGSRSFACLWSSIYTSSDNVYGGTLHCSVQARCDSDDYNSVVVNSNVHRFDFDYELVNNQGKPARSISPDNPVRLCISISKIPTDGDVIFRIGASRRGLIASDRIGLMIGQQYTNGTNRCDISLRPVRGRSEICVTLMLNNEDIDGWIPTGLLPDEQVSALQISIGYRSGSAGLNTNRTFVKLQERQLIVNLSSLYTIDIRNFVQVNYDPRIHPADGTGNFVARGVSSGSCYSIFNHTILPYEVQAVFEGDFTTEVGVRYGYYIIRIRAHANTGAVTYIITESLPSGVSRNPIPKDSNGIPLGVNIQTNNIAVRIHFQLYGTIIFVWKFVLPVGCPNIFNLFTDDITNYRCSQPVTLRTGRWEVLDMKIVAGFFDTKRLVKGLGFATSSTFNSFLLSRWDSRNLMSSTYVMWPISSLLNEVQPTQLADLCHCPSGRFDANTISDTTCLVGVENLERSKRSIPSSAAVAKPQVAGRTVWANETERRNISEAEAASYCSEYADQRNNSRAASVCSTTKSLVEKTDFVTQFKEACEQYAVTTGTFQYTEGLYSEFNRLCFKSLESDAQIVRNSPQVIQEVRQSACPNNCSGNGHCVSGMCRCSFNFVGDGCETEWKPEVTAYRYSLHWRGTAQRLCANGACATLFLEVRPALRSHDAECHFLPATSKFNQTFRLPAEPSGGSTVACPVTQLHEWLTDNSRLYLHVEVQLVAPEWNTSNTVAVLVHQRKCSSEVPVCSNATMTCHNGTITQEPIDGNYCTTGAAAVPRCCCGLLALMLLLSLQLLK